METLLAGLLGFLLGVIALRLWGGRRAPEESASQPRESLAIPTPTAPTVVPSPPPEVPVAATQNQPLSARLHRVAQEVESFADRSAHPRELSDNPQFQELVKLLAAGPTFGDAFNKAGVEQEAVQGLARAVNRPSGNARRGKGLG